MSREIRTIRLRRLQGQLGEVAYQITKLHFSRFQEPKHVWSPPMNAFQCSSCLRVCVELAGVRSENVQVEVSAERLLIRGYRATPEPLSSEEAIETIRRKPVRVLTMEIHHGEFEREIELPQDLDSERFTLEWDNGLLWILIPRKAHA